MEERDNTIKTERIKAWKRKFKEKIGREHLSSVKGFVIAGAIFDVLDEFGLIEEKKIKRFLEERVKQHYNVYVYRTLRYPPRLSRKKIYRIIGFL
ncbi:hypothetical protein AYK25_02940 [Thermoplasmatales archaeon SM1-50]|nr:MAG: hypothetical protein AYK25_02940 [Thermoplasmatales archaeon SM1-50]